VKDAPAVASVVLHASRRAANIGDYVALTKPRLNFLVVLTSAAGCYLGAEGRPHLWLMVEAAVGTALVAGGAAVLNQVYERDTDALMRRTRMRPLPDKRVEPGDAQLFGVALAAAGLGLLAATANILAALIAFGTLVVYLGVYTPMKRRSSMATLVGAVPGALPPLIGWAASSGSVSVGGCTLFLMVFLWQIPHFMAIAWLYRDDYRSAGFPMLPVVEPDGRRTGRQALLYSAALVPASVTPSLVGVSGPTYFWFALALGAVMLWLTARFAATRSEATARAVFFGSITYLPLIWVAMILDH
jgi:protoheme IX farnesyltransferase